MSLLYRFLESTAKEMTPPKPYGAFHLTFWLIGLPVVFVAAFLLRKTSEKQNGRLLFGVGLFLALAEIYKQLFYTVYLNGGRYAFDRFPFQLCSMPMYTCLLLPLLKPGKVRDAVYAFTASFGFMGGFISYFSPESMCLSYWTLTLHSFTWHMLLVFIGAYLFFSGRAGKGLKPFVGAILVYVSCCAIAFLFNLACYRLPGPDVNMFYVGPKPSPLVVCRDIVARFGWAVNTLVYMSALILCAFLFYLAYLFLSRSLSRRQKMKREVSS